LGRPYQTEQEGHVVLGHYDNATNNAMELRAVIEMLSIIPDGTPVWISTDSAYVK
jgi:ribonuclease HI